MTSKEFLRRIDYYSVFDSCCYLNADSVIIDCYRVTLVHSLLKCTVTRFCQFPTLSVFDKDVLTSCSSILFERFSYNQFRTELKYFESFWSRLSAHQKQVVRDKGCCNNILLYLAAYDSSRTY